MAKLPEVQAWREGLTDCEQTRWSSPQSIWNRAPCFHPNGKTKGPVVKQKPMSARELLHMPASEAAMVLFKRSPIKAFAMMKALTELADAGEITKPQSGRAATRAAQAQQVGA
jgi:hypothetical protein